MTEKKIYKIDMHVHSIYSERPSDWILKTLGTRESYVDPFYIYKYAKEKGMDLVTITDHNKIDGIIKLKEKYTEDTIIGVETTTYFPEDGTKIHILLYNFDPILFDKINHLRENIYELRDFIFEREIFYSIAHPFYSVNKKLNISHIEKLILMFDNFEVFNGGRNEEINLLTKKFFSNLNEEIINDLSKKYNIKPYGDKPWIKNLTAGSDDHTGLFIGSSYNYITLSKNGKEKMDKIDPDLFLKEIKNGNSYFEGTHIDFESHSFQILKIAFDFYKNKNNETGKIINLGELDNTEYELNNMKLFNEKNESKNRNNNQKTKNKKNNYINIILETLNRVVFERKKLKFKEYILLKRYLLKNKKKDKILNIEIIRLLLKINKLKNYDPLTVSKELFHTSEKIIDYYIISLIESIFSSNDIIGNNILIKFEKIFSIIFSFILLIPYITSIVHIWQDRRLINEINQKYFKKEIKYSKKIAWFTDTLIDLNGVSVTLRNIGEFSKIKNKELYFITSLKREDYEKSNFSFDVLNFEPIYCFRNSIYKTFEIKVPSILNIIKKVYILNPDEIIISTPGPVGLVGLLLAKILNIRSKMIFHTDFSKEASEILGDQKVESIIDFLLKNIYNSADEILVNTNEYLKILKDKGFDSSKMKIFQRGIDLEKFKKIEKETNKLFDIFKIEKNDFVLLYTGRISKDKNLNFIIDVFRELKEKYQQLKFFLVGDGPYLEELRKLYRDLDGLYFIGKINNKQLPEYYSFADLFVFPSITDTFGMSVLEAQACGLPVIVSNKGGPKNIILEDSTGYILKIDKKLWKNKIYFLIKDKLNGGKTLTYLSNNSIKYVKEKYDINKVIDNYFDFNNDFINEKYHSEKIKIKSISSSKNHNFRNLNILTKKNSFIDKNYKINQLQI